MESQRKQILKHYLELKNMKKVISLIDAGADNETIRNALVENILKADLGYQQLQKQAEMLQKIGADTEAYNRILEIKREQALFCSDFYIINNLIEETEEPISRCDCNGNDVS